MCTCTFYYNWLDWMKLNMSSTIIILRLKWSLMWKMKEKQKTNALATFIVIVLIVCSFANISWAFSSDFFSLLLFAYSNKWIYCTTYYLLVLQFVYKFFFLFLCCVSVEICFQQLFSSMEQVFWFELFFQLQRYR